MIMEEIKEKKFIIEAKGEVPFAQRTGDGYEVITKYSGALVSESDVDSFIANAKGSGTFRGRWNAIVEYFIPLKGLNATQCLLKSQYAVKECMKKK